MMINSINSFQEIYCTNVNCTAPFNAAIYRYFEQNEWHNYNQIFLKAKLFF